MKYKNMIFAERLKTLRKERGLSQQLLGEKIGVSKATISKYENCINPPKLAHAKALADVLSVSFNYLIRQCAQGGSANLLFHSYREIFLSWRGLVR